MTIQRFYPIGTPGQPWTAADKATWLQRRTKQRSYRDEVVAKVERLHARFDVDCYGALPIDPAAYPLFAVTSRRPDPRRPWVLITGGVHGYETSGVHGALAFLDSHAERYLDRCNLLVLPCVSPWAYEAIQRWNPDAIDPNRSFVQNSPCTESAAAMRRIAAVGAPFLVHMDLHETTDTDESEFRPAKAARDGVAHAAGSIPDGFYTVGDTENPQPRFQAAIIASVAKVTHIAPPDGNGQIIGADVQQHGVIHYAARELGLCMRATEAPFVSTTEVYPDSPRVTAEDCNRAQVAAVCGALDFALAR